MFLFKFNNKSNISINSGMFAEAHREHTSTNTFEMRQFMGLLFTRIQQFAMPQMDFHRK